MPDFLKSLLTTQTSVLLIVFGMLLIVIGIIGAIQGKIDPGKNARIAAGVLGLFSLVGGVWLQTHPMPISTSGVTNGSSAPNSQPQEGAKPVGSATLQKSSSQISASDTTSGAATPSQDDPPKTSSGKSSGVDAPSKTRGSAPLGARYTYFYSLDGFPQCVNEFKKISENRWSEGPMEGTPDGCRTGIGYLYFTERQTDNDHILLFDAGRKCFVQLDVTSIGATSPVMYRTADAPEWGVIHQVTRQQ